MAISLKFPQNASPKILQWQPFAACLLIPLAALVASATRLTRGVSCGHDFDFHLISWMETLRSWKQSVWYPHWAQSPNWGAGEPRFVFYPPLTWMLGAALGSFLSWDYIPAVMTFLFLAGAGFSTYSLARAFLPNAQATLSGVLATVTPYSLFVAYERTAFSELAAAAWIPLLLLYGLRNSSEAVSPSSRFRIANGPFLLAPLMATIWLTNAPAGVMASYLLAFAAASGAWLQRSWRPVLRAVFAMVFGLGIAAFYLVPAAWEQRWIAIHQALDVGMRVSDSWLFARHSSPDLKLHDSVLLYASAIFALTIVMAGAALWVSLKKKQLSPQTRNYWMPLALLMPILLLLQLPISAPIWHLPKLEFLQFPWRWLMVLATPYAIFIAAATPLTTKRSRTWVTVSCGLVLLLFSTAASTLFYQYCDEEDRVSNQKLIFQNDSGMEGTDEYAPAGADNSLVPDGLPDGCLVTDPTEQLGEGDPDTTPDWYPEQGSCDDTYTAQLWQDEHKLLKIDSDHNGYVVLRLRRYPAWQTQVNGRAPIPLDAKPLPLRDDGLMLIPVKEGESTIDVRWQITPDVLWGRRISIVSLGVLLLIWIGVLTISRRQIRNNTDPRLS